MPYLMHIAVDNPFRLEGDVHYFRYRGRRFKLIQNDPIRWSDVMLTIVDSFAEHDTDPAFSLAGEFVSALAWSFDVGLTVRDAGGIGVDGDFNLEEAACRAFRFPELPYRGEHTGYSLDRIAHIKNEDQRLALTLYREALSANKVVLSFLYLWHILEVRRTEAVPWIEAVAGDWPRRLRDLPPQVEKLGIAPEELGRYLLQDCRHAIAHIRRRPERRELRFDDGSESVRLRVATKIMRRLARFFVREELEVGAVLYRVCEDGTGFPTYRSEEEIREGGFERCRDAGDA